MFNFWKMFNFRKRRMKWFERLAEKSQDRVSELEEEIILIKMLKDLEDREKDLRKERDNLIKQLTSPGVP